VEKIFEVFYPKVDEGGYHFFSVIVWEGALNRLQGQTTGWEKMPIRILEGRFVIRGILKQQVLECASYERGNWEIILEYAKSLAKGWEGLFPVAEKLYKSR